MRCASLHAIVCVCLCVSTARATTLQVVTDATWRSIGPVGNQTGANFDSATAAWESTNVGWNNSLGYDDSNTNGWHDAVAILTNPDPHAIWVDGTGDTGSTPAFFRKEFVINGTPTQGLLRFGVDDDARVYLNGNLVFNDINGLATLVTNLDVTSSLQPGVNLFAVKAHDAQGSEAITATLDITFDPFEVIAVPEPSTLVLAGSALCCYLISRRRRPTQA